MRYRALASDYDGTLARRGEVDEPTWAALRRLRSSGRKLLLVTGRQIDELLGLLTHAELFDRIVGENGAVIYEPATKRLRTTASAPAPHFAETLRQRGVARLQVGQVVVASWEPYRDIIECVIGELGLDLQIIDNKGALMVLPPGVDKARGLELALTELDVPPHAVVGVGDAENDSALLGACGLGVAVANALDALKARADLVLTRSHGQGIVELVERWLEDDLASVARRA